MRRLSGLCWVAVLAASLGVTAQAAEKKPTGPVFGTLTTPAEAAVRFQAANWLREAGKYESQRAQFDQIWNRKELQTIDKVVATFELGDPTIKQVMDEARDPQAPAPTSIPAALKDSKKPIFFRANLGLAYARALSNRKVYEEALATLNLLKAEQVIDPATYLFHKAVAEHALMKKKEAEDTITRLLDDVPTAPERYKMVAALMHFDMVAWQDKDLGAIGRKMDNIQRRLDLARGGKQTQQMQKEVVARLNEIIKELENQAKNQSQGSCPNGGNCPSGGQQDGNPSDNIKSSSPQKDSKGGNGKGPGQVDAKKIKEVAEVWGKLPEKERAKAMLELTRDIKDPRYRKVVEDYFKQLSRQVDGK